MNKSKRSRLINAQYLLEQALQAITSVRDAEQDSYNNLPDGIQDSVCGESMENSIDALEDAIEYICHASESIDNAL